jgi:hypothetical protein
MARFFDELGEEWNLIYGENNHHHVYINKNLTFPCITEGWSELRQLFDWERYKKITFLYLGNNTFELIFCTNQIIRSKFPTFHTLSTATLKNPTFQVILCPNNPSTDELVSLYFV